MTRLNRTAFKNTLFSTLRQSVLFAKYKSTMLFIYFAQIEGSTAGFVRLLHKYCYVPIIKPINANYMLDVK